MFDGHDPVLYVYPSSPFESAQRGVDALPGASSLVRKFRLAHRQPDHAIVAAGLGRRVGEPPEGVFPGRGVPDARLLRSGTRAALQIRLICSQLAESTPDIVKRILGDPACLLV